MKSRLALLLALILLILAFGCSKSTKGDPDIENAVRDYCNALIKTYSVLDTKPLHGSATEKEMGRIRMIIWQFTGEKKFMESEMKEIRFVKVKLKDAKSADVETVEKWRYRHLKQDTKEVVKPWVDAEYKLLYHLLKEDGKWLVEKAEFLK